VKKLKWFYFVLVLLTIRSSVALEIKTITIKDDFPKGIVLEDYDSPKKLDKISQIKWYQNNADYQKCLQLASDYKNDKSFDVWMPYVHMSCLYSWIKTDKNLKISDALKYYKVLEGNKNELLISQYSGHKEKLISLFLELAQITLEKSRQSLDNLLEDNIDLVDYMSRLDRAQYYKIMGELAWLQQKNEVAKSNFLRSYNFKPDSNLLTRLKSLDVDGHLRLDKYSKNFIQSEAEIKLFNQFNSAVKGGEFFKVAKYGSDFLNQFPGSTYTSSVRDDINTYYKRLLYRRGEKYESLKNDFEKEIMKSPPQYVLFWATEAYERGYQDSSFRLGEKAVDLWEGTVHAADALLLAARSAFYLVERGKAKKYLLKLIEQYSGHRAGQEAQYLLGLLYYREGDFNKVINIYDQFLLSEGSDKWELQVRYWLYRSFKKTNSKRAKEMVDIFYKDFPLTYYGLRVRFEENGNLQSLIKEGSKEISTAFWWSKTQEKRWTRIKKLVEAGWLDEAESEIDFMPDPKLTEGFILRAKIWDSAQLFNRSVKDYASAVDLNPSEISSQLLERAYPEKYKDFVLKSEKEFAMSKNLIWAIMRQESSYMPRAISPSNAYGLMQLLSVTSRETAKWLKVTSFKMPQDIFKPEQNIRFGTHFISRMYRKYKGVLPLAIASYNVGPGNLDRWLSHRSDLENWSKFGESPDDDMWIDELPWAETSFYVKAVLRNYFLYQLIYEKLDQIPTPPWKEKEQAGEKSGSENK
jgi:soluble lytic murein transglycosylase